MGIFGCKLPIIAKIKQENNYNLTHLYQILKEFQMEFKDLLS
ncbi:hypothetical protein ACQQJ8_001815 [Campylobacter coli]